MVADNFDVLVRIRVLARQLNEVASEATKYIEETEKHLEGYGLPVWGEWVDGGDKRLGYGKLEHEWGFMMCRRGGEPIPLRKAPRSEKIDSVRLIPALLQKMVVAIEDELHRVEWHRKKQKAATGPEEVAVP